LDRNFAAVNGSRGSLRRAPGGLTPNRF
jgi:hypothetical protein